MKRKSVAVDDRRLRTAEIRRLRGIIDKLEYEKADLIRGSAQAVASLNASSEHLKRMVDLCDAQRSDITELKLVIKAVVRLS